MAVREYSFVGHNGAEFGGISHDDRRLVLIDYDVELVARAALVIGLNRNILPELALDAKVKLVHVRAAEIGVHGPVRQDAYLPGARNQRDILIESDGPRKCSRLSGNGQLPRR